jgi:hypothetical protein
MTLQEIQKRLTDIRNVSEDDEVAHGREDALLWDFIKELADGECEQPVECANELLKSLEINFSRWFA